MSPELQRWLHDYLGLVVGVVVVLLGIGLRRRHLGVWSRWQLDTRITEGDRSFYRRQCRRRLQVAYLLIAIGTLIGAGDLLIPWNRVPTLFAIYWGGILLMSLWMMLLAIGDLMSSGAHARHALGESQTRLDELRAELLRIKREHADRGGRSRESDV